MLEHIYPINLIEKNPIYAFILGVSYAIIGIGLAVLLFPEDPALVAVAFISIMFYPTISTLMKQEEKVESKVEEFNLIVFLKDHKNVFLIYILFFCGVLLVFSFFALLLPSLATNHIFENQINVLYGRTAGDAIFQQSLFIDILINNWMVLLVIFLTAFIIGDGGVFLIVWNASVWGTIFGNLAKTAAFNVNENPFVYFGLVIVIVAPHMLLEAFAYISSATTGGVMSRGIIKENLFSRRFNRIITNTMISIVFSIVVLVIAVVVETYVLGNATTYQRIIRQSFL